jgi:peptidoglycan hydrolase-like protein with peptidoglycan-binding domain
MRKVLSIGSAWTLAAMLVVGGYAWAADMGTSSDASKSKDSAKSKSTKSTSSDMGSSDMKMSSGGSENVKKVQTALKDKGQDPGPIDGVMGPKTKAAIKAYQSANNMKATGRLDPETAKSLGVEPAGGSSSSASKSSKSSSSDTGADKSGASGSSSSSSKSSKSGSSDTGSGSSGSSFGSDRPSGRNAPSSRDTGTK